MWCHTTYVQYAYIDYNGVDEVIKRVFEFKGILMLCFERHNLYIFFLYYLISSISLYLHHLLMNLMQTYQNSSVEIKRDDFIC